MTDSLDPFGEHNVLYSIVRQQQHADFQWKLFCVDPTLELCVLRVDIATGHFRRGEEKRRHFQDVLKAIGWDESDYAYLVNPSTTSRSALAMTFTAAIPKPSDDDEDEEQSEVAKKAKMLAAAAERRKMKGPSGLMAIDCTEDGLTMAILFPKHFLLHQPICGSHQKKKPPLLI